MDPQRIGRFVVEGRLGQGGMGVVYLARDALLDRRVALKVLPPGTEDDPERRKRLLHEARSAAALSHPNVATVFEAGEDGVSVYLAMELVEGETLADRMARGPLTETEVVTFGLGIARGLAAAHAVSVLHRDLKPANVMIARDGTPKLVDFGLARPPQRATETTDRASLTGTVVGTPGYMAPEQLRAAATDARTDVFALGIVLHEMWAGEAPFAGSGLAVMAAVLYDEPKKLEATRGGAPPELVALVARCLARDPEARPRDASLVVDVLALLAPSSGPISTQRRLEPRAPIETASTMEVVRASVRPRETGATLLGRAEAIDTIESLLASGERLVVITGPPGIGKSRLAMALADRARSRGERTVQVALAGARTIADVDAALLAGLRRSHASAGLAEIVALEDGLLFLDGGEMIAAELATRLSTWLGHAPNMRIVVSSRVRLGAAIEEDVELAGLSLDAGVELFRGRVTRTFSSTDDLAAIREIVRRLDGNPLAIGLAAARASMLSPTQIASRLASDRLGLLKSSTGRDTANLAQAIAWSIELLEPGPRRVLVELSALTAPFDAEAAEAVASDADDGTSVLDALDRLRDASLLRFSLDDTGTPRFAIEENVRAFAERERETGPTPRAPLDRALAHYARLARAALDAPRRAAASRLAVIERAHLRRAAEHANTDPSLVADGVAVASLLGEHGEGQDPVRLAEILASLVATEAGGKLAPREQARARIALLRLSAQDDLAAAVRYGREAVVLARLAGGGLELRARNALALALVEHGAVAEARVEASAALELARASSDVDAEIEAEEQLAVVGWRSTELDDATLHLRHALALAEARRDRRKQASILLLFGVISVQRGHFAEARSCYERARELARAEGQAGVVAVIANNLGVVHHEENRLDDACAAFVESEQGSRASGRARLAAVAIGNRAMAEHERGNLAEARVGYDEAIATLEAVGDVRFLAAYLGARATLHADEGRAPSAERDLASAAALLARGHEPQLAAALSVRSVHVELVLTGRVEARQAARDHLSDLADPSSLVARSDIARMALRLLARRV